MTLHITRRELLGAATIGTISNSTGILALPSGAVEHAWPSPPYGLMCDLMSFPDRVANSNASPSFAWIVNDSASNARQCAYQIQVASSQEQLISDKPDLWNTGRVTGDRSAGLVYAGKPLQQDSDHFWRVRTWNEHGASPYSSPQRFRTGAITSPRTASRYPIVQTRVRPRAITAKGEGRYFIDFGRAAFARLELTGPVEPGSKLVVELGEASTNQSVNPHPGGSVRYRRFEITYNEHRLVLPDAVMPFRYAEISGLTVPLKPEDVTQIVDHYPFDETAASFHCSDEVLNGVWELCRYTIKATSFMGVYIDGDRERKPYEADAYINQLCHYCVDREYTLARYSHEFLLHHATWPTEWQLHSVLMAWADYLYTADTSSLALFYDELKLKTLMATARDDGLVSSGSGAVRKEFLASIYAPRLEDIVDWPAAERDGFKFGPVNSVVNALHYASVNTMARIAHVLGKSDDARSFSSRSEKVRSAFMSSFYNSVNGLFRDGEGIDHYSLHASAFALASGLSPGEARLTPILNMLKSRGMACSVYGAQHLLDGLYNVGAADLAIELMRSKSERSWYHMMEIGSTMTLEAWDPRFKPNLDWNHPWGAAPANIIPRRLMGITPLAPGFRTVSIMPQTADLRHGAIRVPSIAGPITLQFDYSPSRGYHIEFTLPANTQALVTLPCTGATLLEDGKRVKSPHRDGSGRWSARSFGSGTHRLESEI